MSSGIPVKPERAAHAPWLRMTDGETTVRIYRHRDSTWRWWWMTSTNDGRYAFSLARTRRDALYRAVLAVRPALDGTE